MKNDECLKVDEHEKTLKSCTAENAKHSPQRRGEEGMKNDERGVMNGSRSMRMIHTKKHHRRVCRVRKALTTEALSHRVHRGKREVFEEEISVSGRPVFTPATVILITINTAENAKH